MEMLYHAPQNAHARHTAKQKNAPDYPTRWLFEQKLLVGKVLDFGCGFGVELAYLKAHGIEAHGYDPYHLPQYPTCLFDTILCQFVLDVLLPEEQSYVLMCIAELLKPAGKAYLITHRDIQESGFIAQADGTMHYQAIVNLPFRSLFARGDFEIYEYQPYTALRLASECPFCAPKQASLISESPDVYTIYSQEPAANGHALIIPKRHVAAYFELHEDEQKSLWNMANRVKNLLQHRYNPNSFQMLFDVYEEGRQDILHTHIHIIPKYKEEILPTKNEKNKTFPIKSNTQGYKNKREHLEPNTVLVAMMTEPKDFLIAQREHWYRVPVKSAPRILKESKPCYVAFYFTSIFKEDKFTIRWYAKVKNISIVTRIELLPEEILHPRKDEEYYKIELEELQALPVPLFRKLHRNNVFIETTEQKFFRATCINDLFNDSVLENSLWEAFKKHNINADRQYWVVKDNFRAALDFAVLCKNGKIDVECDGDSYHLKAEEVKYDKSRQNKLEIAGWHTLRFTTYEIEEEMDKIINQVKEAINQYGGLLENKDNTRFFPKEQQGGLF